MASTPVNSNPKSKSNQPPKYTGDQLTEALRSAAAKLPFAQRRLVDVKNIRAVQATPEQMKTASSVLGHPNAVAEVLPNHRLTVTIYNPQEFMRQPMQYTRHETMHLIQNSVSDDNYGKFAQNNPDPKQTYNYGGTQGLIGARKQGKTLASFSPEQQAEMMQYMQSQDDQYHEMTPSQKQTWDQARPVYQEYENDLNHWKTVPYNTEPDVTVNANAREETEPNSAVDTASVDPKFNAVQPQASSVSDTIPTNQAQPASPQTASTQAAQQPQNTAPAAASTPAQAPPPAGVVTGMFAVNSYGPGDAAPGDAPSATISTGTSTSEQNGDTASNGLPPGATLGGYVNPADEQNDQGSTGSGLPPGATLGGYVNSADVQPGLLDRLYQTSGAEGLVDLGTQTVERPIDLYHQAVESAQKGDWKAASDAASKIVFGGLVDKDNPLRKAAESIIMQPVEEVANDYADRRKAGQGVVGAVAGTAADKLTATPSASDISTAFNRAKADYSKKNYSGIMGDIVGGELNNHSVGSMPLIGGALRQAGGDIDTDLHAHNYRAAAGDVLGPLLTLGAGAVGGPTAEAGDAADASGSIVKAIKPGEVEVAGQKIPVAADTPQSQVLANMASKEGAKNFIKEQVQPAAVKATQSNFTQSALKSADKLREIQGKPLATAQAPALGSPDAIAKFLQDEAKTTYTKLDKAAQPEVDAWEKQYGEGTPSSAPAPQLFGPDDKPLPGTTPPDIPERPKLFTELQDQIKDAKRVVNSGFSSQADKASAIDDLPKFMKERDDFLTQHSDVVDPGELGTADHLWAQSQRYDWLADRMRSATKGVGARSGTLKQTPALNLNAMESLPSRYDTNFGEGEFNKLLGPEGAGNYDRILNTLQDPKAGSAFMQWISDLPFNVGKPVRIPANVVVDRLLFNPTFGENALKLWDGFKEGTNAAKAASLKATRTATAVAPATVNSVAKSQTSIRDAYQRGARSLGGQ